MPVDVLGYFFSARESVTATTSVCHRPLPINLHRAGLLKLDDGHVILGYTLYHLYLRSRPQG